MIEAVVWDIGHVLAYWEPEAFYDRLIGEPLRTQLFDQVPLHDMNVEVDRGADLLGAVSALAKTHPDWSDEILAWHDNWPQTFQRPVEGSAETLRALKANGVRCVSLTNFGAQAMVWAKDIHPVLREFDQEFVSAELGLIKPDPAIYEAVEKGTGLRGPQLIFTDDKKENIAAAAARGWNTHLFDGASGWRDRLTAEGLLADSPA